MLELLSNTDLRPFDNAILHEKGWSPATGLGVDKFAGKNMNILLDEGPFGQTLVAQSVSPLNNPPDWDGGWNSAPIIVDKTKVHRMSVWLKPKVKIGVEGTSGRLYNGASRHNLLGIDSVNDTLLALNSKEPDWNPYFNILNVNDIPVNEWVLFVGHVHPFSAPDNQVMSSDTGIFSMNGSKLSGLWMNSDYRFGQHTTVLQSRVYHYYAQVEGVTVQYAYPRIDCCDGTEPSIAELLAGYGLDRRKKPIPVR